MAGHSDRAALSGKSRIMQVSTRPTGGLGPSPNLPDNGFQGFSIGYPVYQLPLENTSTSLVFNACTSLTIPAGSDFLAALYYAPGFVTNESLFAKIGPAIAFEADGRFQGGPRALPVPLFP